MYSILKNRDENDLTATSSPLEHSNMSERRLIQEVDNFSTVIQIKWALGS